MAESLVDIIESDAKAAREDQELRERERIGRLEEQRALRRGPRFVRGPKFQKRILRAKRVIVTCAINNVPLHDAFWRALLVYRERMNAELVVLPVLYRNPTSEIETSIGESGWWWPEPVLEFLTDDPLELHEHIRASRIGIQATAINPLAGLKKVGGGSSMLVAHPQMQMRTVATPQHRLPKMLHSTGSVSQPVYSDSAAGMKAAEHHTIGACAVESDGSVFHLRSLEADASGGFYDLDHYYSPSGAEYQPKVAGYVMGDTHVRKHDRESYRATFGAKNSIFNTLEVERIYHHDVFDGESVSPHEEQDHFALLARYEAGNSDALSELHELADFLEKTTPKDAECFIVPSNHTDWLRRWVLRKNWHDELHNARLHLELTKAMIEGAKWTRDGPEIPDPLQAWLGQRGLTPDPVWLWEPHQLHGFELKYHGHIGPNGTRGSIESLSSMGIPVICGHIHGPAIEKRSKWVGTNSGLHPTYARKAPSNWLNTDAAIRDNGTAQLITKISGRWRLHKR